jgi:ribosomal protein S18 acetylase RimI-like enzyme
LTPALEQLAWQSGALSRFRRDARIGQAAFEALYSEWLTQLLAHGTVWEARNGSQSVGLLALDGRTSPARIELVAVAPSVQRQGLGQHLVQRALAAARRQGHGTLQVVTQGNNHAARALYEQSGFELVQTEYIYHCWL